MGNMQRWERWVTDKLTEYRPLPEEMTRAERYDWLAEYIDELKYVKPTPTVPGHYVLIDCDGCKTTERNFSDVIETAAAKWKERNGD